MLTNRYNKVIPQLRPMALLVAGALAAFGAPSFAQDTAPTPAADMTQPQGDTAKVVVTGIRASMQSTLNLKRNSDGIIDGIVADDIGKFPDTNLAEAVQRISGVSIDRSNGEGSRVTVRGVGPDLNMVLLNNRQMPTSNLGDRGSRSFDFANLASEAVSQIQVYKSARADTPPGGLGATINIMTGRPLDLGNQTSIGGKMVYDQSNTNAPGQLKGKNITPEVSALISRKFGTDDMFGVSLTSSYQSRNSGYNQATIPNGWVGPLQAGDHTGNGSIAPGTATNEPTSGIYLTPQNLSYNLNATQRQRTNGQLTFQFRPIKDWTTTLDYTYAQNKVQTKQADLSVWFNHGPNQSSTWVNGPVNSPSNYEEQSVLQDISLVGHDYATVSTLKSLGFNTQYRVNSDLKLSLDAHHSTSKSGSDSPFGTNNNINMPSFGRGTNGADFTQEMPILYMQTTPVGYEVSGSFFQDAAIKQDIDQVQASGSLKLMQSSNLNFGASTTRSKFKSAFQNVQQDNWQGTAPGGHQNAALAYDQSNVSFVNMRDYFDKLGGSGDPRLFTNMGIFNFAPVRENAIKVLGDASLFTPSLSNPSEVRDLKENSSALFAQFNTDWDTTMPMHTGVGLRYERTKVDSRSTIAVPIKETWITQNEYIVDYAAGEAQTEKATYHYFLPTVDWDMDVTSNLKVRASFSTNIGRPRWDQIQGGYTWGGGHAGVDGLHATAGNPALRPVKSKNLDLSAEWYYTKQSMVSLGLFHKDLSGYAGSAVVNVPSTTVTTPIGGAYFNAAVNQGRCAASDSVCVRSYILNNFNGQPGVVRTGVDGNGDPAGSISGVAGDPALPYLVSTITNQEKASLKGAEINLQHMFDNGFGVQANYTYVKSDLAYDNNRVGNQFALIGQSNSANVVGIYEDKNLSVRLAYNWRGEFLNNTSANGNPNPEYVEAYGQVDLSVGYNLTPNLSLSLEAINLTNATQRTHGRTDMMVLAATQFGPRYMLGARYKF
ncbi:MAG: TonB-dependent receptor [Duganella sp.]